VHWGGFAGVSMASTPLVTLVLPPLKAAAILLPILIVQDLISVYVPPRFFFSGQLDEDRAVLFARAVFERRSQRHLVSDAAHDRYQLLWAFGWCGSRRPRFSSALPGFWYSLFRWCSQCRASAIRRAELPASLHATSAKQLRRYSSPIRRNIQCFSAGRRSMARNTSRDMLRLNSFIVSACSIDCRELATAATP
jgi:hypothetical protein